MKARVFIDAFAECLVSVAMARKYPEIRDAMRRQATRSVTGKHGNVHAEATGAMFDRLWSEAQNPEAK